MLLSQYRLGLFVCLRAEERSISDMQSEENNTLRVIVCRPGEVAVVEEIEDDLHAMQELVGGGLIQEFMPFTGADPRYDDVALIVNEEGKLRKMPPSRAVFDEDGRMQDIIAGPFFICYAPLERERFLSIPEDLEEEFRKKFELPEQFFRTENDIQVVRYEPDVREKGLGYERQR